MGRALLGVSVVFLLVSGLLIGQPQTGLKPGMTFKTQRIRNVFLGFSIDLPVGSRAYPCTERRCTFSHWIAQRYLSVAIQSAPGIGTLKEALLALKLANPEQIQQSRRLPNGDLLVVARPVGDLFLSQAVHYFAMGKLGILRATCTAAPDLQRQSIQICSSLKNLK